MSRLTRGAVGLLAAALLALPFLPTTAGAADPPPPADDTVDLPPNLNGGKQLPLDTSRDSTAQRSASTSSVAAAAVGETKEWLALDDVEDSIYVKDYTMRGEGEHIEVWVATDLMFPEGDCRNDERVVITDEQVQYLVDQFDSNIHPVESEAFSVAPDRDGTDALLAEILGHPADYYVGDGDNTVVLIDNVVDDNFFSLEESPTYIAGFFYSVFNEYLNRNVMTIDAYDWLHRTGANPPDEPDPDNLCNSKPARPFSYEGVFAHEYQHLLEYYEDPAETSWVNEGLADYAQTITGYVDPSVGVFDGDFDSHIQCFLGWGETQTPTNPNPRQGGPENSLTQWGDQGNGEEILCDYGAAYSMMEYLAGQYGHDLLTALHRDDLIGLESLGALLAAEGETASALDVVHRWAAMAALDGVLDSNGGQLLNGNAAQYQTPTLDATVDWSNDDAFSTPGAPPNGSDYVRLRDHQGRFLSIKDVKDLSFDGSELLPALPIEWTIDATGDRNGGPALYSGSGPNFDRSIVTEVTVPSGDPTLSFWTKHQTEVGWDFGYVQVSTDGGETYTSLPATGTTSDHDPGAIPAVVAQLPGFTGDSGGWVQSSADLSAYAGQSVLVSFRYITDPGVDEPGFWVDDVTVGGTTISDGSSLEPFSSATEFFPTPVKGWTLQLIAYSSTNPSLPAGIVSIPLGDGFTFDADVKRFTRHLGKESKDIDVVAAIITQDDPTETVTQYAPYAFRVNGVLQPGG